MPWIKKISEEWADPIKQRKHKIVNYCHQINAVVRMEQISWDIYTYIYIKILNHWHHPTILNDIEFLIHKTSKQDSSKGEIKILDDLLTSQCQLSNTLLSQNDQIISGCS